MLIIVTWHRWVSLRIGKSIILIILLSLAVWWIIYWHIFFEYLIYFLFIKFVNFRPLIVFGDPSHFKFEIYFIILG